MSTVDEQELPPGVAAAWGRRSRSGKGPRPGLSLARIVDAALRVAASDGIGAVSMNRVAAELGAATMALYRHVAAKDDLLALMVDAMFRTPPAPRADGEGWRPALERWARAHLAVLRRHPWLVRVPISGPPLMPNQLAWLDRGLGCLAETTLAPAERISVLLLVSGFVRNAATLEADIAAAAAGAGGSPDEAGAAYSALLLKLIDAGRFPALHPIVAAGVFEGPATTDADFEFGLQRILDGVEARAGDRRS
jgi:AcrR family transcriptional regulator